VAENGGDDHWLNALPAELGGDGVTDVVQASIGVQSSQESQALERARERVRIDEEAIPPLAH